MAAEKQKYVDMPGKKYPYVGLGTFTIFNQTGDEKAIHEAVKCAIDSGYRLIDCAFSYGNEEAIGEAIQNKIKDGTITRDQLFITTKLWNTYQNPAHVERAIRLSMRRLQLDYIDLYLIHWPFALKDGDEIFPLDDDGRFIFADHDYVDTWKAMEKLIDLGLVKAIGVSNFNHKQINRIFEVARIPPANIQIEIHPYFLNEKLVDFCRNKGMVITAYAPLGIPSRTWEAEDDPCIFDEPVLQEIAKTRGKSVAQVVLRFHVQRGITVIPKSVTSSRIKENLDISKSLEERNWDQTCRQKLFELWSKLWNTHHNPAHVERAIRESMRKLQLDYINLFLLHWPVAFKDGDEMLPRDDDGRIIFADHDYVDTWKAMEKLVDLGLAKSIGVSNCKHKQINRILEVARIPPANTQIEIHPYLLNEKLVDFGRNKGMTITAYAPLGNPSRTWKSEDDPCIFDEAVLKEIAKSKGKTVAQVVLRFHVQRGIVVVPKSVTPSRIKENFDIFDFELSSEELSKIASLDRNLRFYAEGIAIDHKYYGFNEEF